MRSSADRASPWMSYTHIPPFRIVESLWCDLFFDFFSEMVHVAHRLAYCIHPNVIDVCRWLARQDLCFMLAAWNIKLVFTSKLWLDALDRREELLVSIVWLSSTQPLTGNQHGLHLCSSAIGPSTRMFEDSTSSSKQFISQDGITFLSVGSGDIYLPHMICYCNFPLD